MLTSDIVDQIKKLLDVDSIVLVTAKKTPKGTHIDAGSGLCGEHAQGTIHAMALLMADFIAQGMKITGQEMRSITEERKG